MCVDAAARTAIVGFTASAGLVDSMPLASAAAVVAARAALWGLRRPAADAVMAAASPWARRCFVAGAAALLGQLLVLTAFIIDPYVAAWSAGPRRPWQSGHSCVSCSWVAAKRASSVPDLYLDTVYRSEVWSNVRRTPNLGPFMVDVFEYPPTFLPLPRLLALATPDFWGFRRLWFALNVAGVVVGLVLMARRVDAALRHVRGLAVAWTILSLTFAGWSEYLLVGGAVTTVQTLIGLALAVVVLRLPAADRGPVGDARVPHLLRLLFPSEAPIDHVDRSRRLLGGSPATRVGYRAVGAAAADDRGAGATPSLGDRERYHHPAIAVLALVGLAVRVGRDAAGGSGPAASAAAASATGR